MQTLYRPCTGFEEVNRYIFTSAVSAGGETLKRGVQGLCRVSVTVSRLLRWETLLQMGVQGVYRVSVTASRE